MGLIRIALIKSKCILHPQKFDTLVLCKFVRCLHKCPLNFFPRAASIYKDNLRSNTRNLDSEFPDGSAESILESNDDIFGIESDEGAICFDAAAPPDLKKFEYLTSRKDHQEDVVCVTPFGQIRRDVDNPPRGTFRSNVYSLHVESQKRNKQNQNIEADTELKREKSKLNQLTTKKEAYDLYSKLTDEQGSHIDKLNDSAMITNISENKVYDGDNVQQLDQATHSTSHHFKVQYADKVKSKLNKKLRQTVTENSTDDSIKEPVSNNLGQNNLKGQLNNYFDECYFGDHYNNKSHHSSNFNNIPDIENHIVPESPIIKDNNQENIKKSFVKNSNKASHDDCLSNSRFNESNHDIIEKELADNTSYVDQRYFGDLYHDEKYDTNTVLHTLADVKNLESSELATEEDKSLKYMEETPIKDFTNVSPYELISNKMLTNLNYDVDEEKITSSNNYIDERYFGNPDKERSSSNLNSFKYSRYNKKELHAKPTIEKNNYESFKGGETRLVEDELHFQNESSAINESVAANVQEVFDKFKNSREPKNSVVKHPKNLNKKGEDKAESAIDYVMKLKKATQIRSSVIDGDFTELTGEILDSKGFRVLKNQVPDLSKLTREELLTILKDRILFENEDVVVLNKPYNMVVHDCKTNKDPNLSSLLDDFARMLDKKVSNPSLITVHRLDKETTGCMLLARNELTAQYLKSLFAQRKIHKTYWVVTSRVPDPMEGIIDIPISEGHIDNRIRMVLDPIIPKDMNYKSHAKHGKRAVTHYKVISVSGNAALVEVRPETGVKHQIRVHFGFGLNCPIIGDHKYSHLTKLAPQRLPSDLLQRLSVRQSKVRHIPMHIHARSIVIPQMLDGRSLFAYAPLPKHMAKNLRRLKFRKK